MKLCEKMKKPTEAEALILARCFPASSSSAGNKRPAPVFNPMDECVSGPSQKKKKAFRCKPLKKTIIVLPDRHSKLVVPKGGYKESLQSQRRIKVLEFSRVMTPLQVRSVIIKGFSDISPKLEEWFVLICIKSNKLIKATEQDLAGGDVAQRRGCLYMVQVNDQVILQKFLVVACMHIMFMI